MTNKYIVKLAYGETIDMGVGADGALSKIKSIGPSKSIVNAGMKFSPTKDITPRAGLGRSGKFGAGLLGAGLLAAGALAMHNKNKPEQTKVAFFENALAGSITSDNKDKLGGAMSGLAAGYAAGKVVDKIKGTTLTYVPSAERMASKNALGGLQKLVPTKLSHAPGTKLSAVVAAAAMGAAGYSAIKKHLTKKAQINKYLEKVAEAWNDDRKKAYRTQVYRGLGGTAAGMVGGALAGVGGLAALVSRGQTGIPLALSGVALNAAGAINNHYASKKILKLKGADSYEEANTQAFKNK